MRTCCTAFLDPDIVYPNPTAAENLEPLLVNTAGSWDNRPEATTAIENLFLASDYVRTHTDLATMEGANEAARRAVNGILEQGGLHPAPLRRVAALRAGDLRARASARPRSVRAPPAARATGQRRRRTAAESRRSELASLGASVVGRISRLL